MPTFEGRRSRTICIGDQRTIGLKVKRGSSQYFVGRTSLLSDRHATFFLATPEGWAAAWSSFSVEDPAAAEAFGAEARRFERQQWRDREKAMELAALQVKNDQARALETKRLIGLGLEFHATPKLVVVLGCVVQGGFGIDGFGRGTRTDLYFEAQRLVVTLAGSPESVAVLQYADVVALQVDGPGAVTTGGGFMGGGFGVKGALEGMAMAAILNKLTTKTSVTTIIEIQDRERDIIWLSETISPAQLDFSLKPVYAKLRVAHGMAAQAPRPAPAPSAVAPPIATREEPPADVVQQLEKLAELRRAGVLSEAEFERAKARALG